MAEFSIGKKKFNKGITQYKNKKTQKPRSNTDYSLLSFCLIY